VSDGAVAKLFFAECPPINGRHQQVQQDERGIRVLLQQFECFTAVSSFYRAVAATLKEPRQWPAQFGGIIHDENQWSLHPGGAWQIRRGATSESRQLRTTA